MAFAQTNGLRFLVPVYERGAASAARAPLHLRRRDLLAASIAAAVVLAVAAIAMGRQKPMGRARRLHCRWSRLPVPVVPRLAKACGLVEPRGESRSSASLWWRPHKAHRPGDDGRTQAESGTTDKPASGTTVTEAKAT